MANEYSILEILEHMEESLNCLAKWLESHQRTLLVYGRFNAGQRQAGV